MSHDQSPNLKPNPPSLLPHSPRFATIHHSPFTIILVLLLTAFFRFAELPALPPGLNFDEAGSGVAALEILSGALRIWWRLGGGQEPFWPYLTALSTAIFGQIPLALRLPAAFVGVLTVATAYPLLRTLFAHQDRHDRYLVALLTVLGLAVSDWHLHFSRLGFRAILLPLFSSLAFYFFWRSLRVSRQSQWEATHSSEVSSQNSKFTSHVLLNSSLATLALSTFFVALAIYSYLAARLLWLVPVLFLGLQWLIAKIKPSSQSSERKTYPATADIPAPFLLLISYFLLLLLFFLSPFIVYFLFNPADFVARSTTVSIFNPQWNQGDFIGTAWRTFTITLSTFLGLGGDANPIVNLPGQPALPPILAPFFILGFASSIYYLVTARRSARTETLSPSPLPPCSPTPLLLCSSASPYLFLLCWWMVMLLPALLAPEGAPHHLRLIGAIVPTYALVAIGWVTATNLLTKLLPHASRLTPHASRFTFHISEPSLPGRRLTYPLSAIRYLLPAICYLLVAFQTYTNYFIRWPVSVDFTLPFDLYAVHLANEITHTPPNAAYVLPMDIRAGAEARHYTLDYLLGLQHPSYTYLPVDERNATTLLTQAAHGKTELRVIRWTDDKHREADAKEIITYLLETTARLGQRDSFPVYNLEIYALPSPRTVFVLPTINQSIGAIFTRPETGEDLLRLEAAFIPATASSGQWLPIALTLAPLASLKADYKASLRLMSQTGERLAQKDRVLLHNFHQGTSLWPPERVNEYYLLSVLPETPPGDYTIALVIYHPDTLAPLWSNGLIEMPLGTVRVE